MNVASVFIDVLLTVVIGVIILLSLLLSLKKDVPLSLDVDGIVTIVLRCHCRIIDVASQGNRYYPILDAFRERDWLLRIQDRKLLMVVKRELYICILRRLWILWISWLMINNGVRDVDNKSNNEYEVWQTIDWSWTVDGWEKLKMSTRIDLRPPWIAPELGKFFIANLVTSQLQKSTAYPNERPFKPVKVEKKNSKVTKL